MSELESLQTQVALLQRRLDACTRTWRSVAAASRGLAVTFVIVAAVCLLAATWIDARAHGGLHAFVLLYGCALLLTSIPLWLLARAVRAA